MRGSKCRRTVLRASADSGQRGHLTTSGHVTNPSKKSPRNQALSVQVLREVVGEEISRAMMEYFRPLMAWDKTHKDEVYW
jgi:hypothetical protein